MRKLIVFVALLVLPLFASAQQNDALLTPDGTLYTVQFERSSEHPEVVTESAAYLKLTARRGAAVTHEIIPATVSERGGNYNATMAYDTHSGMLFVFWIRDVGGLLSQLMFTSRNSAGEWAPAATFGDFGDHRKNLRVAVTRKFRDDDDQLRDGLSVHLAWWELNTTTGKDGAKYAMASIHDGEIIDFEPLDLSKFVEPIAETPSDVTSQVTRPEVNRSVLNQPILFTTPIQDSVILVFGDVATETLTEVRVTPRKVIGDGRLRVPGGRRDGGFRAPMMNGNSRIEGVYGGDSTRLALYTVTEGAVEYVVLSEGKWSDAFSIQLDAEVSRAAAVDALRRMVSEH